MSDWSDKTVAVVGLGRTGRAVTAMLRRRGAVVRVTDDAPPDRLAAAIAEVRAAGAVFYPAGSRDEMWRGADLCVTSPGVPWGAPVLEEARRAGLTVVSELEVAWGEAEGHVAAVTGTNGKSTTTELLASMLRADGRTAQAGGNLGRPLSALLADDGPDVWHVAECSSFQLQGCRAFRPEVGVYLNFSPNHLDVHADLEEYRASKARIFAEQTSEDWAVYDDGQDEPRRAAHAGHARRAAYRLGPPPEGADLRLWVADDAIWTDHGGGEASWLPLAAIPLPGRHNVANVMGAAGAALALGCDRQRVREAVEGYRPLPHRLERVAEARGVVFVDDSKATNPEAVRAALGSAPEGTRLILGGRDKGGDWASLRGLLEARSTTVYLIGEAAEAIAAALRPEIPCGRFGSLEEAVAAAFEDAAAGQWVLLAPGCSSFDMFEDYAHRGEVFAAEARRLAGGGPS